MIWNVVKLYLCESFKVLNKIENDEKVKLSEVLC